jgi:hypothetical protein
MGTTLPFINSFQIDGVCKGKKETVKQVHTTYIKWTEENEDLLSDGVFSDEAIFRISYYLN